MAYGTHESRFTDAVNGARTVRIEPTGQRGLVYIEVHDKPSYQEVRIGGHIQPSQLYAAAQMIARQYDGPSAELPKPESAEMVLARVREILLRPVGGGVGIDNPYTADAATLAEIAEAVGLNVARTDDDRPYGIRPANQVTGTVHGSVIQMGDHKGDLHL